MRVGDIVGSYRVGGELGRGSAGVVYAAESEAGGRPVALKVLRAELCSDQGVVSQCFADAHSASELRHPGIVRVYDTGFTDAGSAFLAMERIPGDTLRTVVDRQGKVAPDAALHWIRQICGALAAARGLGLTHRAVKPSNVFLTADADVPTGQRARLGDFGIGGFREHAAERNDGGQDVAYLAPEQCLGGSTVDHRVDLYAVGCLLYEILSGSPPFTGDERTVRAAHIRSAPLPLSVAEPDLPSVLDDLVLKLLSKSASERFATAMEALQAMNEVASSLAGASRRPSASAPPPIPPPFPRVESPSPPLPVPPPVSPVESPSPLPGKTAPSSPSMSAAAPGASAPEPSPATLTPPDGDHRASHGDSWDDDGDDASRTGRIGLTVLLLAGGVAAAAAFFIARSGTIEGAGEVERAPAVAPSSADAGARVASAADAPPASVTSTTVDRDGAVPTAIVSPERADAAAPPLRQNGQPDRPRNLVSLSIESDPRGAAVVRLKDNIRLGVTPYVYEIEPAPEPVRFAVELEGHRRAVVSMPGDRDGVRQVALIPDGSEGASRNVAPEDVKAAAPRPKNVARRPPKPDDDVEEAPRRSTPATRDKRTARDAKKKGPGKVDYTAPPIPLD